MKIQRVAQKKTYDQVTDSVTTLTEQDLDVCHCNSYSEMAELIEFLSLSEKVLLWAETLPLLSYWIIS